MNRGSRDQLRRAARIGECRDCHLPIRFIRITTTDRAMPINAMPDPNGNVAGRIQAGRLVGFVISRDHRPGPLDAFRFMPHAATCVALAKNKPSKPTTPPAADVPLFD